VIGFGHVIHEYLCLQFCKICCDFFKILSFLCKHFARIARNWSKTPRLIYLSARQVGCRDRDFEPWPRRIGREGVSYKHCLATKQGDKSIIHLSWAPKMSRRPALIKTLILMLLFLHLIKYSFLPFFYFMNMSLRMCPKTTFLFHEHVP